MALIQNYSGQTVSFNGRQVPHTGAIWIPDNQVGTYTGVPGISVILDKPPVVPDIPEHAPNPEDAPKAKPVSRKQAQAAETTAEAPESDPAVEKR